MKTQDEFSNNLEKIFEELKYPQFQWKLGTWITVVSSLATVIVFVHPGITAGNVDPRRWLLFASIAVAPFLLLSCLPWLFKAYLVSNKRISYYSQLFGVWKFQTKTITEMRTTIANLLRSGMDVQSFEIEKASFEKEHLYVILRKNLKHELNIGELIQVLDRADNKWMGQFEITEIRHEVYFARGINDVDPVWSGYVRERHEIGVVPDMIAVRLVGGQHGR
jgi:hypothetical protein